MIYYFLTSTLCEFKNPALIMFTMKDIYIFFCTGFFYSLLFFYNAVIVFLLLPPPPHSCSSHSYPLFPVPPWDLKPLKVYMHFPPLRPDQAVFCCSGQVLQVWFLGLSVLEPAKERGQGLRTVVPLVHICICCLHMLA